MKIYEHVEAVPSRVAGVIRLLCAYGENGLKEKLAKAMLQPSTLRPPGKQNSPSGLASRTLDATVEIGIVVRSQEAGESVLRLDTESYAALSKTIDPAQAIRRLLARRLLAEEVRGKPNNFSLLCAWLLTRGVSSMPEGHYKFQEALKKDGFALAEFRVQHEASIDNVLYWARYLGLIWQSRPKRAEAIIPDPTDYLALHMREIIPPEQRVTALEFRERLGELCPVLDGGIVRDQVLAKIEQATGRTWPPDQFSESCSLALRQLKQTGVIAYDCPNDQREFMRLCNNERIAFIECKAAASVDDKAPREG